MPELPEVESAPKPRALARRRDDSLRSRRRRPHRSGTGAAPVRRPRRARGARRKPSRQVAPHRARGRGEALLSLRYDRPVGRAHGPRSAAEMGACASRRRSAGPSLERAVHRSAPLRPHRLCGGGHRRVARARPGSSHRRYRRKRPWRGASAQANGGQGRAPGSVGARRDRERAGDRRTMDRAGRSSSPRRCLGRRRGAQDRARPHAVHPADSRGAGASQGSLHARARCAEPVYRLRARGRPVPALRGEVAEGRAWGSSHDVLPEMPTKGTLAVDRCPQLFDGGVGLRLSLPITGRRSSSLHCR